MPQERSLLGTNPKMARKMWQIRRRLTRFQELKTHDLRTLLKKGIHETILEKSA
jgi:hypothetical protein